MYLIAGLGNPGEEYKLTRHNLGFMVADKLSTILDVKFKRKRLYRYASTNYENEDIVLLKPRTFMNLSGKAISAAMHKYHIDVSRLLIICDDFNLPFGKIRIRAKGSDGGHNGLASIIEYLNTEQFPRLRIGIGSDFSEEEVTDFVLSSFNVEESEQIKEAVDISSQAVLSFIQNGVTHTMNEYN